MNGAPGDGDPAVKRNIIHFLQDSLDRRALTKAKSHRSVLQPIYDLVKSHRQSPNVDDNERVQASLVHLKTAHRQLENEITEEKVRLEQTLPICVLVDPHIPSERELQLEQELNQAKSLVETLTSSEASLKNQIKDLTSREKSLDTQLKRASDQLEATTQENAHQNDQLRLQLRHVTDQLETSTQDKARLNQLRHDARNKLDASNQKIQELKDRLQASTQQETNLNEQLLGLTNQLQVANDQLKVSTQRADHLDQQCRASVQHLIRGLTQCKKSQSQMITWSEQTTKEFGKLLKTEVEDRFANLKALFKKELANGQDLVKGLEDEKQASQVQLRELKSELAAKDQQLLQLEELKSELAAKDRVIVTNENEKRAAVTKAANIVKSRYDKVFNAQTAELEQMRNELFTASQSIGGAIEDKKELVALRNELATAKQNLADARMTKQPETYPAEDLTLPATAVEHLDQEKIRRLAGPIDMDNFKHLERGLRLKVSRYGNRVDRERMKQQRSNSLKETDKMAQKLGFRRPTQSELPRHLAHLDFSRFNEPVMCVISGVASLDELEDHLETTMSPGMSSQLYNAKAMDVDHLAHKSHIGFATATSWLEYMMWVEHYSNLRYEWCTLNRWTKKNELLVIVERKLDANGNLIKYNTIPHSIDMVHDSFLVYREKQIALLAFLINLGQVAVIVASEENGFNPSPGDTPNTSRQNDIPRITTGSRSQRLLTNSVGFIPAGRHMPTMNDEIESFSGSCESPLRKSAKVVGKKRRIEHDSEDSEDSEDDVDFSNPECNMDGLEDSEELKPRDIFGNASIRNDDDSSISGSGIRDDDDSFNSGRSMDEDRDDSNASNALVEDDIDIRVPRAPLKHLYANINDFSLAMFNNRTIPNHSWDPNNIPSTKNVTGTWAEREATGLFPDVIQGPFSEIYEEDIIMGSTTIMKESIKRQRASGVRLGKLVEAAFPDWLRYCSKNLDKSKNRGFDELKRRQILFIIVFLMKFWYPKNPDFLRGPNDTWDKKNYRIGKFVEEIDVQGEKRWREMTFGKAMTKINDRMNKTLGDKRKEAKHRKDLEELDK